MKDFKILNASVDPTGSSGASGASSANNVSGGGQNANNIASSAALAAQIQKTVTQIELLVQAMEAERVAGKNISPDQTSTSSHSYTFDPSQSSDLWKRLNRGG